LPAPLVHQRGVAGRQTWDARTERSLAAWPEARSAEPLVAAVRRDSEALRRRQVPAAAVEPSAKQSAALQPTAQQQALLQQPLLQEVGLQEVGLQQAEPLAEALPAPKRAAELPPAWWLLEESPGPQEVRRQAASPSPAAGRASAREVAAEVALPLAALRGRAPSAAPVARGPAAPDAQEQPERYRSSMRTRRPPRREARS
jgi:hypothetical protein